MISDRTYAQRMLSRAALTRLERYDVFFSAGGKYVSKQIEKVLRFRCSDIHVHEKKQPTKPKTGTGSSGYKKPYMKRPSPAVWEKNGPPKSLSPHHRHTHLAENEDEEEEDPDDVDEEDL